MLRRRVVLGGLVLAVIAFTIGTRLLAPAADRAPAASAATALLFGAGAALTLDEFALWLTFRDVYWQREGRLSVDAVLLFGSLLSIGLWGGRFLRDLFLLWIRVP